MLQAARAACVARHDPQTRPRPHLQRQPPRLRPQLRPQLRLRPQRHQQQQRL